ncbi:MAG: hypothetical protein ACI9QD_000950 [Thermoproteota archaeon]|jgi:hypothetical protein
MFRKSPKFPITLLLGLFIVGNVFAQAPIVKLTERSVQEIDKSKIPTLLSLKALLNSSKFQKLNQEYSYSWQAYSTGSYLSTKEQALFSASPVFTPQKQLGVGIKKNFKTGVSLDVLTGVDNRKFTLSSGATQRYTALTTFTFGIDLWKDFLGKTSKKYDELYQYKLEQSKLENKIKEKQFEVAYKRLYWKLIANTESLKIAKNLEVLAKKQYINVIKRKKASIADGAEVAQYESLVATRSGQVISLNFIRVQIITALKTLIPEWSTVNIQLADYNLDQTLMDVLSCTNKISQHTNTPFENTYYDEVVGLVEKQFLSQKVISKTYSDIDLKLESTFQVKGIDENLSDSYSDFQDNNRTGMSIGLTLTIPLGKIPKAAQEVKLKVEQAEFQAQKLTIQTKLLTSHSSVIKSIEYLLAMIKQQSSNAKSLNKRIKVMQKKYSQARASLTEVILDQDKLINSELSLIETKLTILNTLFDYFEIFAKTPCSINK